MGFFRKEKKLLLQGSKGLTRVYLPYNSGVWGFETRPVHHQQGFYSSIRLETWRFFNYRHPPSNLCLGERIGNVGIKMLANQLKSDNEWIE